MSKHIPRTVHKYQAHSPKTKNSEVLVAGLEFDETFDQGVGLSLEVKSLF